MLLVKGSFKKSLNIFSLFTTHKFVEKLFFNEHLGEYRKWGFFFYAKDDKSF
jgi:hypothetical protein